MAERPARAQRLDFCVTAEQYANFEKATANKGLRSMSEWARSTLVVAAARQLEDRKTRKGKKP
jgi:hypothetical protein